MVVPRSPRLAAAVLAGVPGVGCAATAGALAATFGGCLGCQVHLTFCSVKGVSA